MIKKTKQVVVPGAAIATLILLSLLSCTKRDQFSDADAQAASITTRETIQWKLNKNGIRYALVEIEGHTFVMTDYQGIYNDEIRGARLTGPLPSTSR